MKEERVKLTKLRLQNLIEEEIERILVEKEEPTHDRYEATLNLAIDQDKPIDRTGVMNQIRAIRKVTTVYREAEVSTSPTVFIGTYKIRFVLPRFANASHYYERELKPKLNKILGLRISTDYDYVRMDD